MDLERLILLKNLITSNDGMLLIQYAGDFITSEACKNLEANEIKGMCRMLHKIKNIPEEFIEKRGK